MAYSLGGNYKFQVDVTDNSEPGSSPGAGPDTYAIRVWDTRAEPTTSSDSDGSVRDQRRQHPGSPVEAQDAFQARLEGRLRQGPALDRTHHGLDSRAVEMPSLDSLVAELAELIAIPSVSADPAHQADVAAAAEWVAERVRRARRERRGDPLGRAPARRRRDPRLAAPGGRADDPLLRALRRAAARPARALGVGSVRARRARRLALRPRRRRRQGAAVHAPQGRRAARGGRRAARSTSGFACDGEEEVGGHSIVDWIAADERGADAAIVFDSGMVERDVPGFNIAVRGVCYFHVKVRTGLARPSLRHVRRRRRSTRCTR